MILDKFVYKKLVKNENDILGIIAFGLYKKQELLWIESFKNKKPTKNDYLNFYRIISTNQQLMGYKEKATEITEILLKTVYENELQQIKEQSENELIDIQNLLDKQYEEDFEREIKRFKPSFWKGVWQSVIGSFFFILLIGVLFFFTWSLTKGPKDIIENIFQVKITSLKKHNLTQEGSQEQ